MGALGGHMAHLHESLELTFNELATILDSIANADVEATEKVDGQNLFLTVDETGSIRTARNGGDLKTGGMTPEAFASKWAGHPAEGAFTKGFEAIALAINGMGSDVVQDLFAAGKRYVNMEVMYPGNPNMIVYDAGNVVLHNFNTFDEAGEPISDPDAKAAFSEFSTALDQAEVEVDGETWTINAPVIAQLQALADGSALAEVQSAVAKVAGPVGMDATIGDLAELRLRATAANAGLPPEKIDDVLDAAFQRDGAKKVTAIKKGLPKDQQKMVSKLATKNNAFKAISAAVRPLELAINDFAIEVLRGMESFFVSNTNDELQRQRSELQNAIEYLEGLAASGDEGVGALVDKQLEKLKSIEDVASTMEGVVFEYPPGSGQLKKLTGTFAMANQLVGGARRKGMGAQEKQEESYNSNGHSQHLKSMLYEAILNEQSDESSGPRVGLIPVSGKPYHAGHHYLVEKAAAENEEVILFVSTSDRVRKGQFPIYGADMQRVWKEELENIMPSNVRVEYGGSPVRKVYDTIGEACKVDGVEETYIVYSDPSDTAQNYTRAQRDKYMQPLCDQGQVIFAAEENPEAFTRGSGSPDVSGTKLREALEQNNFKQFASGMPSGVSAQNVWNILKKVNEGRRKLSLVEALFGGRF
jgi:phosphopantetheine adenylyltransferase|tara:strand:+ start:852 stop:2780 length:1929 start_codon:yes stop_codon:yes gene_type:complete